MVGFLIPPSYIGPRPSQEEIVLADIVLGFFLACACFVFVAATNQTATRWRRIRKFTAYLAMIWVDWAATFTHSLIGWCVGHGTCPLEPSFWIFFAIICMWAIEMQCLTQILANRLSLLIFDPARARLLKMLVFFLVLVLTTSVIVVWTPARMEVSAGWMRANAIWDRGEKVCFLVLDIALNMYFIHLVRSTLVANGLEKYRLLYLHNVWMVALSIFLDAAVIGSTWLPDYWIYIQFRPLTHMVRLYIEMCNAELIGRVATASVGAAALTPTGSDFSIRNYDTPSTVQWEFASRQLHRV